MTNTEYIYNDICMNDFWVEDEFFFNVRITQLLWHFTRLVVNMLCCVIDSIPASL